MSERDPQLNIDFEGEEQKLHLTEALEDLIRNIEGSLPEAHLRSLLTNKSQEVLGELTEAQQEAITHYVEVHKSYSQIDPTELASDILGRAA